MQYQISRNGQMYGPYTMEDLQRYLASGHVLLTDLAKSEEMPEWIPVSQILGPQQPQTPPPGYAPAPPNQNPFPPANFAPSSQTSPSDPPNLHWALVLLLDVVTCSLFQMVWNIILGAWFKRVVPSSKTLALYIASAILILMQAAMGQTLGITSGRHLSGSSMNTAHAGAIAMYSLVAIACWVVRLFARFNFRSELEQHFNTSDPVGLRLNPVLTFFFGGIYIQSQLNRVNDIKRGLHFR